MNKIFGIGLSHTGTRSLDLALTKLGFKSIHWATDRTTYRELSNGIYDLTILKTADALSDITASPFYAEFDRAYPGSKFVLTVRDQDKWVHRMSEHLPFRGTNPSTARKYYERFAMFSRRKKGVHRFLFSRDFLRYARNEVGIVRRMEFQEVATYGAMRFRDAQRLRHVYDTHVRNVLHYFADRPNDLLVMNVAGGDSWDKLCPFLGIATVPNEPFPHRR